MFDGEDQNGFSVIVEAKTIITDAETKLWWLNVLEALYVTFAGGEIAPHNMKNA